MQTVISRITEIEADAKKRGIPISHICERGKINNSTYQRWKTKLTKPSWGAWEKFTGAYEKIKSEQKSVRQ